MFSQKNYTALIKTYYLSLVTRSLKRTHLASLLGSCSKFEMLQMLIHLMPDSLSIFVLVR